jgi:CheY-like chemotaxis protein/two-component sensor histidine kinase
VVANALILLRQGDLL